MNVHKGRKSITQRPFRILADCERIYQFLLEIYERDWRNGVPAPFFEYAYASFSYWMDISYSYKNRIWECNGEIVAFCFYELHKIGLHIQKGGGVAGLAGVFVHRLSFAKAIERIHDVFLVCFCCIIYFFFC